MRSQASVPNEVGLVSSDSLEEFCKYLVQFREGLQDRRL